MVRVSDDGGTVLATDSYDEYGIPAAGNYSAMLPQRFQYTGQAWLPELGMYHYKARLYSPTLGRFLQTDPIGYDDQVNLLATAQRRGELAAMRWSQVDRDTATWEIPGTIAKNGKPNLVPLSDFAMRVLDTVPRFDGCDLVFTTNRRTPVSGFSKMLGRIGEAAGVSGWRLHDLRRTAASGMARAGVAPHIVEKVLNHISGTISGVAAVCNRYGYTDEKRAALDVWGRFLDGLD